MLYLIRQENEREEIVFGMIMDASIYEEILYLYQNERNRQTNLFVGI
jgi:hypothetical protein